MPDNVIARKLQVGGIVQGVGFRPFVFQLAHRYGLKGSIANTSSGVTISLEGPQAQVERFCRDLPAQKPPLARIDNIVSHPENVQGFKDFSIIASRIETSRSTLIAPDVCVCSDCLKELFDPADRRYRYPFINCTHCGPRHTIIDDLPYDRCNTSMKHFKMCRNCRQEYDAPENRRFHAQPNACPACGPQVRLFDNRGNEPAGADPVMAAARQLQAGRIVAVKGLGGFHLAVDAENEDAMQRLRARKQRPHKPFALMAADINQIRPLVFIDAAEESLLTSRQRPIVLLKKKTPSAARHRWMESVAPRNNYLGLMLAYTPLHYLILACGFRALVMTSGNRSGEPIAITNDDAFELLGDIADYFLIHDRDIYQRSDDSIVRQMGSSSRLIRRSRGYAPLPIRLRSKKPMILACGGALKNTVCLTKGAQAFLSPHIGDLESAATFDFFQSSIADMKRLLGITPEIIAHDLHPDYPSTRYALKQQGIPKIAVQHHHAHIVSCMAENGLDGPVIGLAFDGTGYGSNGHLWGGEIMIAEAGGFKRIAHLVDTAMPGGAAAIYEPWRMAISYLYHAYGGALRELDLPLLKSIEPAKLEILLQMIRSGINSPQTSSMGRLFDGIAALIGLPPRITFEGQAPMELETISDDHLQQSACYEWHIDWEQKTDGACHISIDPIVRGVVGDMQNGKTAAAIGARFHQTLIVMVSTLCESIRKESGLNRVVMSGGVFQNALLFSHLTRRLEKNRFQVFAHRRVPANDGGIALGQAVIAGTVANVQT